MKTPLKPRIIQATTVHSADDIRVTRKICASLHGEGYDVTLLAPYGVETGVSDLKEIRINKPKNKYWRILSSPFRAIFKLTGIEFEVFHFHDPELLPAGIWFALKGKKIVFDVHENIFLTFSEKSWIPGRSFFQSLFSEMLRLLPPGISYVLAESSYLQYFERSNGPKVIARNFPVNAHLKKFHIEKRDYSQPRLFYVGGVSAARGAVAIMQALEILMKRNKEFTFDCVGPFMENLGSNPEFLRLKVELGNRVRFHGRLSHENAYKISRDCNLGVAILMPLLNYLESYPTKVFEYMTVGLPYLYSDFPSYKKLLIGKGGEFVNPQSPSDIAAKIEELFADPARLERQASKGAEMSVDVDWDGEYKKILSLY